MNGVQATDLDAVRINWLNAQLEEALKAQQKASRSAERAARKLSNANGLVNSLQAELGICLIQSWGESPDLSVLLCSDEGYGMPMYQAFLYWSEQAGLFVPGGYYADTRQRVIGVGVDAADEKSLSRAHALVGQVLPVLKTHDDGRKWLVVQQSEYVNCSIELRIADGHQTNVVRMHYGMIEEEHTFDDVYSALLYVREHYPCNTTFDGSDSQPLDITHQC